MVKCCWIDQTWLSSRTRNITEAPWNKSGWRSHTGCQVLSASQCLYYAMTFYHWCHFQKCKKHLIWVFNFWIQGLWRNRGVLSQDLWDPARSQAVLGRWSRLSRPHALQALLVLSLVLLADSSAWEQWVKMPECVSFWVAPCETQLYFSHQTSYIWNTKSSLWIIFQITLFHHTRFNFNCDISVCSIYAYSISPSFFRY